MGKYRFLGSRILAMYVPQRLQPAAGTALGTIETDAEDVIKRGAVEKEEGRLYGRINVFCSEYAGMPEDPLKDLGEEWKRQACFIEGRSWIEDLLQR